jgi:hypothetical protein
MPYTDAQFIAYQVETLTPFSTKAAAPTGTNTPLDDLKARMDNLLAVMNYCQPQTDTSDTTLKVFVAPEFFLRFPGGQTDGTGHYDWVDVTLALHYLKKECEKVARFKHWLIVPGTVVFSERKAKVGQPGKKRLIFNSLPVFMGDGSVAHTINKRSFDDLDKLDKGSNGANQDEAQQKLQFRPLGVEGAEFKPLQVGGINIGFEICADHGEGRLKTYQLTSGTQRPKLSIHVVTACGKPAKPNSAAATQNGFLFRCDGNPGFFGSNDYQVTRKTVKNVTDTDLKDNPTVSTQKLPDTLQLNRDKQISQVSIYGKRTLPQIQPPTQKQ